MPEPDEGAQRRNAVGKPIEECPYCLFETTSDQLLWSHLLAEHPQQLWWEPLDDLFSEPT